MRPCTPPTFSASPAAEKLATGSPFTPRRFTPATYVASLGGIHGPATVLEAVLEDRGRDAPFGVPPCTDPEVQSSSIRLLPQGDAEQVLPNDQVFVLAGGILPTAFLKATGIQLDRHFGKRVEEL